MKTAPPPLPAQTAAWQNPKPLALHMSLQTLTWFSALSAFPHWKNGSLTLRDANGKKLNPNQVLPPNLDLDKFSAAVTREACHRLEQFVAGIRNYQHHARQPRPQDPPILWSSGSTRLLDYGVFSPSASAVPILVIPSLINRAYILDLAEDRSLMRTLADAGLRPLLIDWGWPKDEERQFGLDDYICGRLQGALNFTRSLSNVRPGLLGYCMGGNLALALTQRNPDTVAALALLATPWDFHSDGGTSASLLKLMTPALERMITDLGVLPVDMLHALFAGLDPSRTGRKFHDFAHTPPDSETATRFVALEDWVNDGVPLPANVARECLFDWYVKNAPHRGDWSVGGHAIDPAAIHLPTFAAIPTMDNIVPPSSAHALADALPNAHVISPSSGHIGMIVGAQAVEQLHLPLAKWFSERLLHA